MLKEKSSSDGESPTPPPSTQPVLVLAAPVCALPGMAAAGAADVWRGGQGAARCVAAVQVRGASLLGSVLKPEPGCPCCGHQHLINHSHFLSARQASPPESLERFCLDVQLGKKKKKKSIYLEGPSENNVKEITAEVWCCCKEQPVALGPAGWSQQLPSCCGIPSSQCHHLFPVCLHRQQLLHSRGFLKRKKNLPL